MAVISCNKQYAGRLWPQSEDVMYNWTAPGWQCLFSYSEARDLRTAFEAEFTFASCVGGLKWAQHTGQCLRENTCVCLFWDTPDACDCSALKQKKITGLIFHFRTGPSSLKWFPTWRNACAMLRYIITHIFLNVIPFNTAVHDIYVNFGSWCLQPPVTAAAPCRPPPPLTACSGEEGPAGATWLPCGPVLSSSTLSTLAPMPSGLRGNYSTSTARWRSRGWE